MTQDLPSTRRARTDVRSAATRRFDAPVLAVAALALSSKTALAFGGAIQAKPQLTVESERSPQGARLTFKGKGWGPSARVKTTVTRAPGASGMQDFGMFSADSTGTFPMRKVVACSTTNMEDGQNEQVTFTAADSATSVKASRKVQDGAWVCQ